MSIVLFAAVRKKEGSYTIARAAFLLKLKLSNNTLILIHQY